MKVFRHLFSLALLAALVGCAGYQHVPKDYTGPTAVIRDFSITEDRTKAQIFAVTTIDGNRVGNAFSASRAASQGTGSALNTVFFERQVKAGMPVKVTLLGSHATGAPIHEIASKMAGTFFSVEGVVEFTPQPGGEYIVRGELKKERSSVWIEDIATRKTVASVTSN
jgi:hypothetical protein